MAFVPLNDITPINQYTASAGQTEFVFSFSIFTLESGLIPEMKVFVNDVLKTEVTDYAVKKSDGSPITAADIANGLEGGKVVFNSGLTLNDKVTLSRDLPVKRTTGYTTSGDFRTETLNVELNKILAVQQQLERDIARSVSKTASDAESGTITLPANRASKFLAFDASGNMIASAGSAGSLVVSAFMATVLDDVDASSALTTLGFSAFIKTLIDDANAAAALTTLGVSAYAQTLLDDADASTAKTTLEIAQDIPKENLVVNPEGFITQEGSTIDSTTTPANNDDTYFFDQWILLSDGNDIVDITKETTGKPTGSRSAIKFDVETASKKFGMFQPLTNAQAEAVIGGNASLAITAKKGSGNTTLETLRMAIVSWDGTVDSITSDIVSAWNGAGTDPTLATNWTYENTPSNLVTTSSYQTFKIENIAIDTANTKNIGVFIWVDDVDATVGDTLFVSKVKLEEGSISTPYQLRNEKEELELCQLFTNTFNCQWNGVATSSGARYIANYTYPTKMRAIPSLIIENQTNSARYPIGNALSILVDETQVIYSYTAASPGGNDSWIVTGFVKARL